MERMQRRATRCVQKLSRLDYDERCTTLQLPMLSYRRHRANMLIAYNILHQNINVQPGSYFHQVLEGVITITSITEECLKQILFSKDY